MKAMAALLAIAAAATFAGWLMYFRASEKVKRLSSENSTLRSNLNEKTSLLTREQKLRADAEHSLAHASKRLGELERRGNLIYTLTVHLDLEVEPASSAPVQLSSDVRLGTVIYLIHRNGPEVRLINREQAVRVSATGPNRFRLQFTYVPENARTYDRRQIDVLSDVHRIRIRYGSVLDAIGLKVSDTDLPIAYSVAVNDVPVVSRRSPSISANAATGNVEFSVHADFANVFTEYSKAVAPSLLRGSR